MTLDEFFNPHDINHVMAYRHLEETGSWPKGFLPEEVYNSMGPTWHVELVGMMAQAWLKHMEETP